VVSKSLAPVKEYSIAVYYECKRVGTLEDLYKRLQEEASFCF